MPKDDLTSGLSYLAKRQLAFVLYSGITVDKEVYDPDGEKLSDSLLSNSWSKCAPHGKLKGKLSAYIFKLIKHEVSVRIDRCTRQRNITATQQYLQQLNNMWMKDSSFAKKYGKPTNKWPYQDGQCDACMIVRVAQDLTALRQLRRQLEDRASNTHSQGENPSRPRLLCWVKMFLDFHKANDRNRTLPQSKSISHSHDHLRPSAKSGLERKPQADWIERTNSTIKRWQELEASDTVPVPAKEARSGHGLDCYTPGAIARSRTVHGTGHNRQRSHGARQQLSRNPLADKPTPNITDHYRTLKRSFSLTHRRNNESDYLMKNDHRTIDGEQHSRNYNQRRNHPCSDAEDSESRRYSVASLSSNYSLSPPGTPVMEQPTSRGERYNDALSCPAASETSTATAAGTAAVSTTCAGAGNYGSNGDFDTDLESVPGLEHDIDARHGREHDRPDATEVAQNWEQDSPKSPSAGDPDEEWDDDEVVYESDEDHSRPGDEHGDADARANGCGYGISEAGLWDLDSEWPGKDEHDGYSHGYGYNVASQQLWDLDLKGLAPVEQSGGLPQEPRDAASSASVLTMLEKVLFEDRGEEWGNAAISGRR
ncbi:hypothetical protein GX51_04221 [Blastomyces parvus]|uniref:Uncharacterized protein n=1 Tax=Blastomyces parvus TaxID=2060905 RepID=A0A2B7X2B4_9EURO|nr:hypothetical protein GX51_04221 [Blastomyces parvus]